ncbi:MAG: sigma-70 family RNA polymerase sigma factor [Candidatus Cloacimonetes bacterium]|nr:sigma-70 family RNA polymerase sigma factor [Candidatus Cloacimonadota bacterium]
MKIDKNSIVIEEYVGLVRSIVSRYRSYSYPMEDLMQEGMIGLMEAKERFDGGKGASFTTYAAFWVKKRIIDALNRERKESMDAIAYDDSILNEEQEKETEVKIEETELEVNKLDIPHDFPEEEKKFLNLHFTEKQTLSEIAKIMNLSRERIRQLKQKALRRMKLYLKKEAERS